MIGRWNLYVSLFCAGWTSAIGAVPAPERGAVSSDQVREALERAGQFYAEHAAIHGGYHERYSSDLKVARSSKRIQGQQQIAVTGSATPAVGMAFLIAHRITRDEDLLRAARRAGMALVRGQLCSGGWDYGIEFDPKLRPRLKYRIDVACDEPTAVPSGAKTNLDNNATQGALRFLMRLDRALGFADQEIHHAALFALAGLRKAQFPNGAWPQRFQVFPDPATHPVISASLPKHWARQWSNAPFHHHYTLNDECTLNAIDLFLEASRIYQESSYLETALRGGEFLIAAQFPEPQPGWAQQYDTQMHPVWARAFEPPAIAGRESLDVMRTLLLLYRETGQGRFLEPIPKALRYLKRSYLRRSDAPTDGPPRIARFYELHSNRPLFLTKGSRLEVQQEPWQLLDGYELTYDDLNTITHYTLKIDAKNVVELAQAYLEIKSRSPGSLRRSEVLESMTPWRSVGQFGLPDAPTAAEIRRILEALDSRGAWVQEGGISVDPTLLALTPGQRVVVQVGEQRIEVSPDTRIEVLQGSGNGSTGVIHSGVFCQNVRKLSEYLTRREVPD